MKSIRVALISAVLLTSPMLSFAGGQHLIRVPTNDEMRDRTGVTPAVQAGKETGMARQQTVQVNASRSETAAESQVAKDKPSTEHPNLGDHAFRK